MYFILLSFLPYLLKGDWIQIDSSFYDTTVSINSWKTKQDCSCDSCSEDFQSDQCSSNPLEYNKLKKDRERIEKTFSKQSFQVYVIFDAYFNHADTSKDSDFYVTYREDSSSSSMNLYTKQYKASDLNQMANRICTGGSDYEFDLYTISSTTITNAANKFTIKLCLNPEKDEDTIFIRNLLVYVNICYPTCKTCSTSTTIKKLDFNFLKFKFLFFKNKDANITVLVHRVIMVQYHQVLVDVILLINLHKQQQDVVKSVKETIIQQDQIIFVFLIEELNRVQNTLIPARYHPLIVPDTSLSSLYQMFFTIKILIWFMMIVTAMILLVNYTLMKVCNYHQVKQMLLNLQD